MLRHRSQKVRNQGSDGTFSIRIGGPDGDLTTGAGASEVFVRHTLADWNEAVGPITIERVGDPRR